MNSTSTARVLSLEEAAEFAPEQVVGLSQELAAAQQQVDVFKHQLEWYKRQLFGHKSERRIIEGAGAQLNLGELIDPGPGQAPQQKRLVSAHTRSIATNRPEAGDECVPFFDETRVPVELIELPATQAAGLAPEEFEVISYKDSYRLAQRPGSYVVLKYRRPVIKLRETQSIVCASAPSGVIEGSRAEVSFVAGVLIDKFAYHIPLYRQHQRLGDCGITVSRPWLTQIAHQGGALLEPIYAAQFASIRESRVKAMDETPIKAGRAAPGKMKATYYWPVYGEQDEVCFPWFPSRAAEHIYRALGLTPAQGSVLLTDGYGAYKQYAEKTKVTHAQCWAHLRRGFFDAQPIEPEASAEALEQIRKLYAVEAKIREGKLAGENKRLHRVLYAKPIVDAFFDWVDRQFERQGLLPSNPLTKALAYGRERRLGLEVFLNDPDVPIDTNHLERALRAIPMGRKAWLFCWTELGAKHVGIVQSLLVTCRLHGIDPYTYLVDVLQRVGQHPAARVAELTPRLWKQYFAANPLRSDLHRFSG
jgi:transposase